MLLIAFFTMGMILLVILFACLFIASCKRKQTIPSLHNQAFVTGMQLISSSAQKRISSSNIYKSAKNDKRAIINDSNSETSEDTIPYIIQDTNKKLSSSFISTHAIAQPALSVFKPGNRTINNNFQSSGSTDSTNKNVENGNSNRVLTVMIPRAKYYPSVLVAPSAGNTRLNTGVDKLPETHSMCSTSEAKLLSYLDASPSPTPVIIYFNYVQTN